MTRLPTLPIDDVLLRIQTLKSCVLVAPTGAGKTVRVPPALLTDAGQVVVVEPRRVAARSAAARVAFEQSAELGGLVGYRVRHDDRTSARTRIVFMTPGLLLAVLKSDPFLETVSTVVFDEFHERGLDADLALGFVRLLRKTVRPDLNVVVMSATLDPGPITGYLGVEAVVSRGRTFPVDVAYRPKPRDHDWPEAVAGAVTRLLAETDGGVLAFLPGVREIRRTIEILDRQLTNHDVTLLPLYGDLSPAEQDRALRAHPGRNVVVSTNVAEASVTVEGITAVVDSGVARQSQFDPALGLNRLILGPVSRAEADQRSGRAGRLRPGVAIRLWDEPSHRMRPAEPVPEVRRVDVAQAVLALAAWNEPGFEWLDAPRPEAIDQARRTLTLLEALDADGQITPLGRELDRLPCPVRVGRLLHESAALGVLDRACQAAAALTEFAPLWETPARPHESESDLLAATDALVAHPESRHTIRRAAEQYRRLFPRDVPQSSDDEALLIAVARAFPDRIARRRGVGERRGLMVGGRGVALDARSQVRDAPLFVCLHVQAGTVESPVAVASAARREWLSPRWQTTETRLDFDADGERVVELRQERYLDLVLGERSHVPPPSEAVGAVLLPHAMRNLARVMPGDDSAFARRIGRWRWLTAAAPDLVPVPFQESVLHELLGHLVGTCRSFADLRRADWGQSLHLIVSYADDQRIDQLAPESFKVPSGSVVALDYGGGTPVLAVRIQELFGLAQTPTVAAGRVRVRLHLLAPNGRVAQITDDLASFWRNGYPVVRKELRGRYPKHSWPDDPLAAMPLRGTKKQG